MQAVAKIFLGNLRTVAKKIDKAKEVQCVVSCLMMLEPKLLPGFTSYCLQDEPKCHGSLSRNSNNGVSLLLLWQVSNFLDNVENRNTDDLPMFSFLWFPSQNATTHCVNLKLCPRAEENHLIWSPMGANNCPLGRQLALASEISASGRDLMMCSPLS